MELSKTKNEAKGAGFFLRLALLGSLVGAGAAAWQAPSADIASAYYKWRFEKGLWEKWHQPMGMQPRQQFNKLDAVLSQPKFLELGLAAADQAKTYATAGAAGGAILLPLAFYILFNPSSVLNLFRRREVEGAADDVRQDSAALEALAAPFDSASFIDLRKGIFMGLGQDRRPRYLRQQVIDKNHIEILGESGVGKSSLAGVVLSQLAAAGETIVVFDPKNDRNLPGVLARAGAQHGFPVRVLDLRPQADFAQVNPFKNARVDQVEELIQVALELGKTGDAGVDFYRGKDREATSWIGAALEDGRTSILELLEKAGNDERVTEQENLWRELRQVARLKAFHTTGGLNLEDVLSKPGVLYIIGSTTRLEVVAGQKLLLQRCLQILDERADSSRPVCLFLDELKYILSPAALRAAGTIRDRNCHLVFAHQSLGDLDDCPGLSPKAVRGAIWGNCGVKIVYKMLDSVTARELETIAGQTAVRSTSTSESDKSDTLSTKIERGVHMPAHIFTHLPKPVDGEASVGVVIGLGPAWFLSTRFLPAGPAPRPVPAEPEERNRVCVSVPEEVEEGEAVEEAACPDPNTGDDDLSDLERK